MEGRFVPGRLVSSIAGRDSGKFYLVLDVISETRVRVVDGRGRKVSNPKIKNIKHLRSYPYVVDAIAEKSLAGQRITDLDVRKALQQFLSDKNTSGEGG